MESQDALVGREAELDAVEVTAKLFDAQDRAIPNTLVDLRPVSGSSTVKRKIDTGTTTAPGSTGFNQAPGSSGTPTNTFTVTDLTAETATYEAVDRRTGSRSRRPSR